MYCKKCYMWYNFVIGSGIVAKVKINYTLKSNDEIHKFEGKGIKNGDKIAFNDNGVMTTITLGENVFLERKKDYLINLGFCTYNSMKGTYIIPEGSLDVETATKELICDKNNLKIIYSLTINDTFVDNFELNFNYSIDSNE
ncbi:MAG: DUF1934 family protein [Bacilli bacterium]|nr:DUF1934 family protein [Bacilli bacterium]